MNAALKRHRIDVEAPVETQDDTGEATIEWYSYFEKEPAEFTPMGGVEVLRGRQLESQTKAVFKVNYREGYSEKMRILFDGKYYGITHINPVGVMRLELELLTRQTA